MMIAASESDPDTEPQMMISEQPHWGEHGEPGCESSWSHRVNILKEGQKYRAWTWHEAEEEIMILWKTKSK